MGERRRAGRSRAAADGPKPFFGPRGGAAALGAALRRGRPVIVFLDYDGTLAPIRSAPEMARLEPGVRDLLGRVARLPRVRLGIISGRFMEDLAEKVGLGRGVFLAASHGLEIKLDGRTWIHPRARACPALMTGLSRRLAAALKRFEGVTVEEKRLTLSVHYRNAGSTAPSRVKRELSRLLLPYRGTLKLAAGKKVFEVMPDVVWDKGGAVLKIVRMLRVGVDPLFIYLGDDRTDEDAFRALRPIGGLTVRVGRGRKTEAEYFVDVASRGIAILELIERVVLAKDGGRPRSRPRGGRT